jgi:hypothetical protein
MKRRLLTGMFVAVVLLVVMVPVFAHHSANWAENRESILKGKVISIQFINPHIMLVVQGKLDEEGANGALQRWEVESASPARARRAGWNNATFKSGDDVVVYGRRARDGKPLMNAQGSKYIVNGKDVDLGERESGYAQ